VKIKILPPEVTSQIAAGEVIERPASVVKELVENALDAGANHVIISVEGAGKTLIEVTDNGSGIPREEMPLAVERHATSKLRLADDLFHITTLGFRGEALASIGSVSRLTMTSRTNDNDQGTRIRVEGGKPYPIEPAGAPTGTFVRVEDLFYNVPARLKFLKTDTTERRLIDNLVTHYALAYPNVRFNLLQEGRQVIHTSGKGEEREILAALYGTEIARQMLEVNYEDEPLVVRGFIGPTSLTRANRREITLFVNGRPVQDSAMSAAVLKGYHTLLMVGRYPIAILFLELPSEEVDVNVHPTKAEVRFHSPERVFSAIQSAVRRSLLAHNPITSLEGQLKWGAPTSSKWGEIPGQMDQGWKTPTIPYQPPPPTGTQSSLPVGRIPILRLVGQIANAYLVAEGPDGLYLIDQHAAHERILFEKFVAWQEEKIPSQILLQPATVQLSPANYNFLNEHIPFLSRIGFDIEPFGSNTMILRAVPVLIANRDPALALNTLVEDFEEDETPLLNQKEARLIARICKRAAVKSGQSISTEEQRGLLYDLESCQSPRTCPHGRPTMIHLSMDLLERQFGRRGAR